MELIRGDRGIRESGTPESAWRRRFEEAPLPRLDLSKLAREGLTVHVVAPHPDDEILGSAGLLQRLARHGARAIIHALSDGEASHPASPAWPPLKLIQTRREESLRALRALSIQFERRRLSLPDGALEASEDAIVSALSEAAEPGDLILAPWAKDGHPDHEAAGRAAKEAARARGASLLEIPIWGWNRCAPQGGEMPLRRAQSLLLGREERERKREAIACFKTQLERDESAGRAPILSASTLSYFRRRFEVFFHDQL